MAGDQLVNLILVLLVSVSTLVLVSIGLAVVFGMMGVINLAHGEFLMLGAFGTILGYRSGLYLWLAMLLAAIAVGLLGLVVEMLLIRHLYGRLEATMLATWGLSLILVQATVLIFGATTQGVPTPLGTWRFGQYSISEYNLVLMAIAIVALLGVHLVFTKTSYGTVARAVTQNPEMAAGLGVNAARINRVSFGFGSALAGLGGALLAPLVGVVPNMGQAYVARAFMTVVVGGSDVVLGTAAAAGLLGAVDSLVSNLSEPFIGSVCLLLTAIVIVRVLPTGLTGRLGGRS